MHAMKSSKKINFLNGVVIFLKHTRQTKQIFVFILAISLCQQPALPTKGYKLHSDLQNEAPKSK